jgi:predicted amidohydrolase
VQADIVAFPELAVRYPPEDLILAAPSDNLTELEKLPPGPPELPLSQALSMRKRTTCITLLL